MKHLLTLVVILGLAGVATPASGQKPDEKRREEDRGQVTGTPGPKNQPPRVQPPKSNPEPRRRVEAPPKRAPERRTFEPPSSPKLRTPQQQEGGKPADRGWQSGGNPTGQDPSGQKPKKQQPEGQQPGRKVDPGRLNPPQTGQPGGKPDARRLEPPKSGHPGKRVQPGQTEPSPEMNAPKTQRNPRAFGQPEAERGAGKVTPQPNTSGGKPELLPPGRDDAGKRRGWWSPGDAGDRPSEPQTKGKPSSDVEPRRKARHPITPSGKQPEVEAIDPPKTGLPKARSTDLVPSGRKNAGGGSDEVPARKRLGKPSQPDRAPKGGEVEPAIESGRIPLTSGNVEAPRTPAKLRRLPGKDDSGKPSVLADSVRANALRSADPKPFKPVKPVEPVHAIHVPEGGRRYGHGSYHHEYAPRSSWYVGLGLTEGSTSLAFGYSSGGFGYPVGYSPHWGAPWGFAHGGYYSPCYSYWHYPAWCGPVYYQPYYAVPVPVYYAPVYYPVAVVDPWAYNSSSFAFGFSSFGGSALSSFSFAYASSNWSIGIGWSEAPAYTVYTPAYDPYVRAVWIDGYYDVVSEQVWVPGRHEEVVNTPVVETVVDPLGNTYDAVIQPGSVDYVWHDGYWTIERRRIWSPGHFEYVSAF